jgi:hypothetical protein
MGGTVWRAVILGMAAAVSGCGSGGAWRGAGAQPMAAEQASPSVELLPRHVGKRIRAVLQGGTQILVGKVVDVDPGRDRATLETNYGSRISFRPSQITVLEELASEEDHSGHGRDTAPEAPTRLTMAPEPRRAGGLVQGEPVKLLVVDFTHPHKIGDCLKDLVRDLRKAPSTVAFVDATTTARLRVPVPEDVEASLVPFSWHVHVLSGPADADASRVRDVFRAQNSDGDVEVPAEDLASAQQLVLVGTPHRVEGKEAGVRAIAPPRMVALDLVEAEKAAGMLENNPEIVRRAETPLGRFYAASQSANDSEMILSLYDPERRNASALADLRFSVQDGLLVPGWTLEFTDGASKLWQKVGAYPVPPYLSHEVPEATRITLEVGEKKLGDLPAPAMPSCRVPETALVRADVDFRYGGLRAGAAYTMLVAHGVPQARDKARLFNPRRTEVKAETRHESVEISVSDAPADVFPCQAFVWYQLSTPWRRQGGMLLGAGPLLAPETKAPPKRRRVFLPAPCPGIRFITFNGPKLTGTSAAAGVPAALGARGLGGSTLGTGGPYVPFTAQVSSANTRDNGSLGRGPVACAHASPMMGGMRQVLDVTNTATATGGTAIAICNCGGGGGCGSGGSKTDKGGVLPPTVPSSPGRPSVPSIDRHHPGPHPHHNVGMGVGSLLGPSMSLGSVAGW